MIFDTHGISAFIQVTDITPPMSLEQACQTGGPIACLMRPAVTNLSHTVTWNCK